MLQPDDIAAFLAAEEQDKRNAIAYGDPAGPFPLTDLGNAERLVAAHGYKVRFVAGIGWRVWDGRRWRRDDTGELMRRAKLTARAIYHDAANCDDADERKRILAWARASESESRLRAMVSLAETEAEVVLTADRFDADPWALTVLNGTIDLQTGELRPHDSADLVTKLAPVRYDPDARSERWERFLERVTGGDTELEAFFRRLCGYTIAGVTDEEVLAFAHGPGATGKTTALGAIGGALGDYSMTADFETFLERRGDGGIRNDVARLAGARMVASIEVDEGKKLAEGLIKGLTGGDTITARFLYQEAFEFTPRFTLWLCANDRPRVRAEDDALWRRVLQIPFVVVIPPEERDPDLKRALRHDPAEQTAILAWLVRGCLEWQRGGLNVPDRVRDYTAEWRAENDPIAEWIADECEIAPHRVTTATDLRANYENWCTRNGFTPIGARQKKWSNALKHHGCEADRGTGGVRQWRGIGLRSDAR